MASDRGLHRPLAAAAPPARCQTSTRAPVGSPYAVAFRTYWEAPEVSGSGFAPASSSARTMLAEPSAAAQSNSVPSIESLAEEIPGWMAPAFLALQLRALLDQELEDLWLVGPGRCLEWLVASAEVAHPRVR